MVRLVPRSSARSRARSGGLVVLVDGDKDRIAARLDHDVREVVATGTARPPFHGDDLRRERVQVELVADAALEPQIR